MGESQKLSGGNAPTFIHRKDKRTNKHPVNHTK